MTAARETGATHDRTRDRTRALRLVPTVGPAPRGPSAALAHGRETSGSRTLAVIGHTLRNPTVLLRVLALVPCSSLLLPSTVCIYCVYVAFMPPVYCVVCTVASKNLYVCMYHNSRQLVTSLEMGACHQLCKL